MRYYFDLSEGGEETRDVEGTECTTEAQMQRHAAMILAEIACDSGLAAPSLSTRVRDAQGRAVYQAHLRVEAHALGPRGL